MLVSTQSTPQSQVAATFGKKERNEMLRYKRKQETNVSKKRE